MWPPLRTLNAPRVPVAGIQATLTRSTIAAAGPSRSRSRSVSRSVAPALGDAADRAVGRVGDPAVESERHRLAQHEVAEADALDAPDDRGIEPDTIVRVGEVATAQAATRPARPGEDERVEDQLRRDVRRRATPRTAPPARGRPPRRARSTAAAIARELVEQDGVVDRSRAAGTDEHEVAGDVRPQPEQDLDAAAAFGGWGSGGRGDPVVGVGRRVVVPGRLDRRRLAGATAARRRARRDLRRPVAAGGAAVDPAASAAASAIARGIAARAAASRAAGPASVMSSRSRVSSARMRTASGARA